MSEGFSVVWHRGSLKCASHSSTVANTLINGVVCHFHSLPLALLSTVMVDIGYGSVSSLLSSMETGVANYVPQSLHGHSSFMRRFKRRASLEGHLGCVNRLAFSEDASLFISGSDDCTLRIWSVDSATHSSHRATVTPGHQSNIFGVAFMPGTGNHFVASAGLDTQVRHTHVETNRSSVWLCHEKSVKTVSPLDAHTFVSASRDGTVRLFDARLPATVEPTVVVRMPAGLSRPIAFNSAIPSPVCQHHLLVSAHEPYVRVFDLRMSQPPEIVSAKGYAIESYCPPHLHPSAPEQSTHAGFRGILATYANFSPDGKHIVATYFEDTISVFDRRFQDGSSRHISASPSMNGSFGHPVICKSPFVSRRQCLSAIRKFQNNAARLLKERQFDQALAAANHVLSLDDRNLFGLLCRAYALQKRKKPSDFRAAYCALQKLIDIVRCGDTGEAIAYLWTSSSDKFGYHGLKLSSPAKSSTGSPRLNEIGSSSPDRGVGMKNLTWTEMRDLWIAIFEYMQIFNLSRMITSAYHDMLQTSRSKDWVLTMKRLEYLGSMCSKLEAYRDRTSPAHSTNPRRWAGYARRALGRPEDEQVLYPAENGPVRRYVLSEVVESFHVGLDKLRKDLTDAMAFLRLEDNNRNRDAVTGNTLEAPISLGSGHTLVYIVQQPPPMRRRQRQQQQDQRNDGDEIEVEGGEDGNGNEMDAMHDGDRDHIEYVEGYGGFDEGDGVVSSDSEYEVEFPGDLFLSSMRAIASNSEADKETSNSGGATADNDEAALWGGLTDAPGYRSFLGHVSRQTDIKEANFFGSSNQVILSGSDDGLIYMWNAATGELLNTTNADDQIVNCVLGHPHHMMILASGIDESIKILTP